MTTPDDVLATESAINLADRIRCGNVTAAEVLASTRRRVEALEPQLNAFTSFSWNDAELASDKVDRDVRNGNPLPPLAGVPFAVKDLHHARGVPTRRGSRLHSEDPPARIDSPIVARLREAGAIPIGKSMTAEYGMSSDTATVTCGFTRNPWNLEKSPGGSSGGTAAAVAAGLVPFGTGSDLGGSIRSPASLCGLVGLKTTQGVVPRDAGASDMNVDGVLTRTVRDAALLIDLTRGPDRNDKLSQVGSFPTGLALGEIISGLELSGLRATWSGDLGDAAVEPELGAICATAARELMTMTGIEPTDCQLPSEDFSAVWMTLASMEFFRHCTALEFWPDRRAEMDPTTVQFLECAARLSSRELGEAERVRARLEIQVGSMFEEIDLLITPTVACDSFPAGGPVPDIINGQATGICGPEPFTMLANLTWIPAISFPVGLSETGVPVGLQVQSRWGREDQLLAVAAAWEAGHPQLLPPLPRDTLGPSRREFRAPEPGADDRSRTAQSGQ